MSIHKVEVSEYACETCGWNGSVESMVKMDQSPKDVPNEKVGTGTERG